MDKEIESLCAEIEANGIRSAGASDVDALVKAVRRLLKEKNELIESNVDAFHNVRLLSERIDILKREINILRGKHYEAQKDGKA